MLLGHIPWNKGIIGKIKQPEECKLKHSEIMKKLHREHPEYYIQKTGSENVLSKKVNQYDFNGNLIKTWDNIRMAAKELNINDSKISAVCKFKRNKTGGYVWRYA